MSNRFKAPSAEEMAARGLNPDGTPMKKSEPSEKKPAAKKSVSKKKETK